MQPFKAGKTIVNWGLRLLLVSVILFQTTYEVLGLALTSVTFYFALIEFVLAILLLISGFGRKEKTTVIVSLVLTLLLLISFLESWPGEINETVLKNLLLVFTSFYFVVYGNRN